MATINRSGFGRPKVRGAREHFLAAGSKNQPLAFRIAGVQMASGPNVSANLNEVRPADRNGGGGRPKLVALPEYFAIMGLRPTDKVKVREKAATEPIQAFLAETAARLRIWLVGCSVPMETPSKARSTNSCQVYDDAGKMVARYDKIHLFSLDRQGEVAEQGTIETGKLVKVVDSRSGASAFGLLRPAFSRVVSCHEGRGHHRGSVCVHRDHRAPTGKHWSGARHRKPVPTCWRRHRVPTT